MIWLARTGARWRHLPDEYGKSDSVFRRCRRWLEVGVFDAMLESLAEMVEPDPSADKIDSTIVRAHHCAAGIIKGPQQTEAPGDEALGRSRGGFTSKLHARCDAKGRPPGYVPTGGEAHDIKGFAPLLRMIADKIEALLADNGYDADTIPEELAAAEIEAVIPAKRNRKDPAPHDTEKNTWRNLIGHLFNKLRNWRRIATRYDKSKEAYLGFVATAAVKLWLSFVHNVYILAKTATYGKYGAGSGNRTRAFSLGS